MRAFILEHRKLFFQSRRKSVRGRPTNLVSAHTVQHFTSIKMAALTTTSVRAVSAVSARKANFAGSRASFAAPAKAPVSARASLKVQAANRELWCVTRPSYPLPIAARATRASH
jgi:hypothetical protein